MWFRTHEDRKLLFVAAFALLGVVAPILWVTAYRTLGDGWQTTVQVMMMAGAEKVIVALWPASVLMIADPRDETWQIPAISAVLNGLYYAAIGLLVWLGWRRNKVYWALCLALLLGVPLLIISFF